MNSLQKIRIKAKQAANNAGHPVAIYNLNQYSPPLYVVRDLPKGLNDRQGFIEQVDPD